MAHVGQRIELEYMADDPDPIPRGERGTITWVSKSELYPQIGVAWDNGRTLMLVPGKDQWRVVGDAE
jgi:hypothetical protein